MRKLKAALITNAVKEMCIEAAHNLPRDVLRALKKAKLLEKGLSSKILGMCLDNAKIAAGEMIPLCQDTGTAVIFAQIGQDVFIEGDINNAIEDGVRRGYKEGYLRKSIVSDPLFERENTRDNTPPVTHFSFVKGDKVKITVLLKGAGSENNSKIKMFTPAATAADIEDFVIETVKEAGSKACPPMVIGVGVGGNFETCALLAKEALGRKLGSANKNKKYAALEASLLAKVNKLGIGPQGLGGKTTALGVMVEYAPCHMASLPVAVNIGCHSNRHISRTL
jgi:fumarate hydratase subunit alpha